MKTYVHARLTPQDRVTLERLKRATGCSESELIRRGLRLVAAETGRVPSALELAGPSVGKFTGGAPDLSSDARHLDDFGR